MLPRPLHALGALALLTLVSVAQAVVPPSADISPAPRWPIPTRTVTAITDEAGALEWAATSPTWSALVARHPGWTALVDVRTRKPSVAWGPGIPLLPGAGNDLTPADIGLGLGEAPDLALVEQLVRTRFFAPFGGLLGVPLDELVLDATASARLLDGKLWSLDFVHAPGGVPVEGSVVGVRINSGNIIQFGTVALAGATPPPPPILGPDEAIDLARSAVGGASLTREIVVMQLPVLVLVPLASDQAFHHVLAWRLRFSVPGEHPTWEARIDAATGAIVTLHDANAYACEPRALTAAQVLGGVLAESPSNIETSRPLPFALVVEDGISKVADRNGLYTYGGGASESRLDGRHANVDCVTCATPAQAYAANAVSGRLDFGTGGVNDDGNGFSTRAERTTFFHVNLIRSIASKWYAPGSPAWLDGNLGARVNIDDACNAFWNGTTINMFHGAGGCGNTGEVAGIVDHEWGHGLDQNTGNNGDGARGEGFADVTDLMAHHRPEIGPGFFGAAGPVRCLDYRTCDSAPAPLGVPLTVANVTTYCPPGGGSPLGTEVHCEGEIYGQANWDLSRELVTRHGLWGGWHVLESLFFPAAFPSTTYLPADIGGAYWAYVAADDDDGNLSNGTPHGAEIYRAFDLHGIAPTSCGTHVGCLLPNISSPRCAPPPAAAMTATATISPDDGTSSVQLDWPDDPAAASWNVYRSDFEADDGMVRLATGLTSNAFTDNTVGNGLTYYYAVQSVGPTGCTDLSLTPVAETITLPQLEVESVTVSDVTFGNGNGVFDPGERLEIIVRARNIGSGPATGVTSELRSNDPSLVSLVTAAATYPLVPPGGARDQNAPFVVDMATDAYLCGSTAPMAVILRSIDGCWYGAFAIDLGRTDASATGTTIDDSAGNGNGRAEPGEDIALAVLIRNDGTGTLTGLSLDARCADPRVSLLTSTALVPDLAPGETRASAPFSLRLDTTFACPDSFDLELAMRGDNGCWSRVVTVTVGRNLVHFEDRFDTDRGWRYGDASDLAGRGAWTRGIPNGVFVGRPFQPDGYEAGPVPNWCVLTGNEIDAGNAEAGDLDRTSSLFSPPIDLTGETSARLEWRGWWAVSDARSSLELRARKDGGAWAVLRTLVTDAPTWTEHVEDLAAALGSPLGVVELAWLADGDAPDIVEAAIDDVRVVRSDCASVAASPDLALLSLSLDDGSGPDGRGNANGVVDAGESVALVPTLSSTGSATAERISVDLRVIASPPLTLALRTSAAVIDLAPAASATSDAPHFRLRFHPDATCGSELVVEVAATFSDAAGNTSLRRFGPFTFPVGTPLPAPCDPFTDPACTEPIVRIGVLHGFESVSDAGWAHGILRAAGVTDPDAVDDWQRKAPVPLSSDPDSPFEGLAVFGTDLGAGPTDGAHEHGTDTFLESPRWDASRHSRVHLRYARWLGIQGSDFDSASVSVNGAEVWRNAGTGPLFDPNCVDPLGASMTYASDAEDMPEGLAGWKLVEHDVSALADHASDVTARWSLDSDGSCAIGGWTLDAVELRGVRDVHACTPHDPCASQPLLVDAGPDTQVTCASPTVMLAAVVGAGDDLFGRTYRWTPALGLADPLALSTDCTRAGTYTLTVTDIATGCVASDSVVVGDGRTPPSVVASSDGPLTCVAPATLRATVTGGDGSGGFTYSWSPPGPASDPLAAVTTVSAMGTYTVTVTDVATGCTRSAFTSVTRDITVPVANAGPDRTSICGGAVTLAGAASGGNGSAGYSFLWSPAAGLDDATVPSPSTSVPGTYTLEVTAIATGCTDTDTVVVRDLGDLVPPVPVGALLRVRKTDTDVVLDLSLHAGAASYNTYRSIDMSAIAPGVLDPSSPLLVMTGSTGPIFVDAGMAQPGSPWLLGYRIEAVSSCGVEEP